MKIVKTLFFLLPVPVLWALFPALGRHPVSFFVLRGSAAGHVEAFRITSPLDGSEPSVEAVRLDASQQKEGDDILAQGDTRHLLAFAKSQGLASAVIGMPSAEEKWPGYLGGGLRGWEENENGLFDNLQWSDRIYLAFAMKVPPPAPFLAQAAPSVPATVAAPATVSHAAPAVESPAAPSLVRVEILNGCGITNAADWVARRVKGPGIIITDTGNADNFDYGKTLIRTSAGTPVALEDAADRLGITPDSIEETDHPVPGVDAVVIVGKDFPKLRRRWSGRIRHGTE